MMNKRQFLYDKIKYFFPQAEIDADAFFSHKNEKFLGSSFCKHETDLGCRSEIKLK